MVEKMGLKVQVTRDGRGNPAVELSIKISNRAENCSGVSSSTSAYSPVDLNRQKSDKKQSVIIRVKSWLKLIRKIVLVVKDILTLVGV